MQRADRAKYLCSFNYSLHIRRSPSDRKSADVTPVLKRDLLEPAANYRPISPLLIVSKVMERCVCNRLYCHVSQSITSLQHEFMLSRLCSSQLFGEAPNKKQTDRYFVFWLCHGFRHSWSRHSFWKAEKVRRHWSTERLVFWIPKGQVTESCGWWHSLWAPTGLFRCSPGQSCWPIPLCDIYQCVDMLTVSEKRRGGGGGKSAVTPGRRIEFIWSTTSYPAISSGKS